MLDIQPSLTLPRFAFAEHDEVIMEGISYRAIDRTEDGYVLVRTDGTGVSESFSHAVLSQRVTVGRLEHRRDAFLPEIAKRRLRAPAQELSTLSAKLQQKAKYHESLVRAFTSFITLTWFNCGICNPSSLAPGQRHWAETAALPLTECTRSRGEYPRPTRAP